MSETDFARFFQLMIFAGNETTRSAMSHLAMLLAAFPAEFERIGLERERESILGHAIPTVKLPVHAASNLATLVELAIRDWQLRLDGINAALRLDERLRSTSGILDDGSETRRGDAE